MAGETAQRMDFQDFTAGFAFIAIAVAILVAWMWDSDWWLIPPILFIEFGIWGILLGSAASKSGAGTAYGSSDSSYYLLWGFLLAILGFIWFANKYVSGIAPASIAVVLIFMGAFILYLSWSRSKKTRGRAN
jgi:hypothetical protein